METLDIYKIIYEIVRQIPKGRATSYGAIAKCVGLGCTSRMVGRAMSASHNLKDTPAHRVVNREGKLTGFAHFATPTRMQELLESEGLTIKRNKIVNFKEIFWNPDALAD